MIHEYKTVRLYYGNDFDQTVDRYIKDGWAVFNIWPFDGAGQHGRNYETPTVQKMQVIITFIRIQPK